MLSAEGNLPKLTTKYSGRAEQIYMDICYTLSERIGQVDWAGYSDKDWSVLARMSDVEGVAPLVYWNLKERQAGDVDKCDVPGLQPPPAIYQKLRKTYYNTLAHNTLLYQELERLLKALDEAAIPVIVLKGAALALTVYEDIGLRPMGDLDLFVQLVSLDECLRIFQKFSYRIQKLTTYHVVLSRVINNIYTLVEVHWNLSPKDVLLEENLVEWIWDKEAGERYWLEIIKERKEQSDYRETITALSNSPPWVHWLYLLIHASIHNDQYRENRIMWFYDIHLFTFRASENIEWSQLSVLVNNINFRNEISNILQEVRVRFNTIFPVDILIPSSEIQNRNQPASTPLNPNKDKHSNGVMAVFRSLSWSTRIRVIFQILFLSPADMRRRYQPNPVWLWPIYYPYRWIKIFRDL